MFVTMTKECLTRQDRLFILKHTEQTPAGEDLTCLARRSAWIARYPSEELGGMDSQDEVPLGDSNPARSERTDRRSLGVLLLLLGLFTRPAFLAAQTPPTDDLVKQAAAQEKQHEWLEACRLYDEVLRRGRRRDDPRIRQAYQRRLRCYHIVHRHQDPFVSCWPSNI